MELIKEVRLVCTDIKDNHNKIWIGKLYSTHVRTEWGRVGESLQSKEFPNETEAFLNKKVKEKEKKGYTAISSVGTSSKDTVKVVNTTSLFDIAMRDIMPKQESVKKLVKDLIDANKHQIKELSGSKVEVNASGLVTTVTGDVIDIPSIKEAKDILNEIKVFVDGNDLNEDYEKKFERYLMLVPQYVNRTRGWHKTFFQTNSFQQQYDFLDMLEKSVQLYEDTKNAAIVDKTVDVPKVFDFTLTEVEDATVIAHINKLYKDTAQSMHSSYGMKVDKVWEIDHPRLKAAFESKGAKMNNVWELWHGTASGNVMSIMHTGLKCAPPSTAAVCGRMFGNGVYFSDQSTKSLNYATGYWRNSNDSECYMFMNQVAMGTFQVPKSSTSRNPDSGFDSYFAKARESGVANNEMIVFDERQFYTKYLVKFKR